MVRGSSKKRLETNRTLFLQSETNGKELQKRSGKVAESQALSSEKTAQVSFEDYRKEWLKDIFDSNPSAIEVGRRFGAKLITQWLDVDLSSDDIEIIYCDGSKDGGIDIAYLSRRENRSGDTDDGLEGDTWYLVQSKYGTAFRGGSTLITEGRKIIETLSGQRKSLASIVEELLERLTLFRSRATEADRIVLVFATEDPLTEDQKKALEDVRILGRERLGTLFNVGMVSIKTIYQRVLDQSSDTSKDIIVPIEAKLVSSDAGLLVGTVPLLNLYEFLKAYKATTDDLNLLYEKNVRRSLGLHTQVNKSMRKTLKETPELFGLYNNGITIVVTEFQSNDEKNVTRLTNPYVVNGCQTTQMIWHVCEQYLDSGGSGSSKDFEKWYQSAKQGVVITKIVMVATGADLRMVARSTNTQNTVREQDFVALESDFTKWAREIATKYNIFMEIQRGEWESQQAKQRNPQQQQFKEHSNAFDLLKVYGSGWLSVPGVAFGDNAPFVPPTGWVYKQIIDNNRENGDAFGADDLYVAYRLKQTADAEEFGRKGDTRRGDTKSSRRQTRFLFYMIVLELLRNVLVWANTTTPTPKELTQALLKLFEQNNETTMKGFIKVATRVIDEFLKQGGTDSVFTEAAFLDQFHGDLGGYMKWNKLGRDIEKDSPNLYRQISFYRRAMGLSSDEQASLLDRMVDIIKLS